MNILIIKTSSYGDIIQSFDVLEYIHQKFSNVSIDWIVCEKAFSLVSSHPLVRNAISFKNVFDFFNMKSHKYDVIFDIQGNIKSGIITFFSRGKKIGFDFKSSSEWPNIFFTNKRYRIDKTLNIRFQYLSLIQKHFQEKSFQEKCFQEKKFRNENLFISNGRDLKISEKEKKNISDILKSPKLKGKIKILVSLHSKWKNKRLKDSVLLKFLEKILNSYNVSFIFLYENEKEKTISEKFFKYFFKDSILLKRSTLAMIQNLINRLDGVISYDSCLLHFCKKTPSFSIFGPSKSKIYKPIGKDHLGLQGKCPYGVDFIKRCPYLRSCKDPRCMDFKEDELFYKFSKWIDIIKLSKNT